MEHIGIWAIFLTSPAVILLSAEILIKFSDTIKRLDEYTTGGRTPRAIRRLASQHLNSLYLSGNARHIVWFLVIVGFYCWLLNVKQTLYPMDFYGNDVFDAHPYPLGFYSFKIYLLVLWTTVYPLAAFIGAHTAFSMALLLRSMCNDKLLRIDLFHSDNCGGVSVFGSINVLIMCLSGCILVVVFAIMMTHSGSYLTVSTAAYIFSSIFIVQSIAGVYYIHLFVASKKDELLREINNQLNTYLAKSEISLDFPENLLMARNHIAGVRTFPYAKSLSVLVNFLRFAPPIVATINIISRL